MTVESTSVRTTRQRNEAEVYDARAAQFLATIPDEELVVAPAHIPYPNREHVAFLDDMFERMGPLDGIRTLEVGCGSGTLSTYLALHGARPTGVDVSSGMLALAAKRATINGVGDRVTFVASPIETLDLPDGSFDVIFANQVLHHLDLPRAMPNIRRLLAPGGQAIFIEPVLFVPEWMRSVRYSRAVTHFFPSRADTPDERSLDLADIRRIRATFERSEMIEFQLLTRLQNFVELSDRWFTRIEGWDAFLLRQIPLTRRWCRYVVLVLWPNPIPNKEVTP